MMESSMLINGPIFILRILSFFYDLVTFPIFFIIQRPLRRLSLAKRLKAKPIAFDKTQITYRSTKPFSDVHIDLVKANVDTLDKMLNHAAKLYPLKRCLGTRTLLREDEEIQPNGQVFKKCTFGEYKWRNYMNVHNSAINFGRGLRELGHMPGQNVVIFAESRAEWMIAAHGCFKQNFPIVTIYATLGDDGVIYGINETEATVVITSHDLWPKLMPLLPDLPNVKTIIYMEDQLKKLNIDGLNDENVRILPFKEVVRMGSYSKVMASPPSAEDIAIIMYTSGSTGTPKGVLITHQNCICTVKGFADNFGIRSTDVLLGSLPLAHVYEILAESICLLAGVPIGYSSPTTLTDFSPKLKRGTKGDITVLKPTILTSVPMILERIRRQMNDQIKSSSKIVRVLFKFFYQYKRAWTRWGFKTPILDQLFFKKLSNFMGGRIRQTIIGGAPLSCECHEFIKICLCTELSVGYGLTETTSGGTATEIHDLSFGRVGSPLSLLDFRLVNWNEGGYRVSNKPFPQGEIIIGGYSVARGYYKSDAITAENFFDEDGRRWFKTGDIGEFHEDGVMRIIDRKKDLVKLQSGEFISLGKIETEMKTCPIIDDICVCADSTKDFCIALIMPNPKHLIELASAHNIEIEADIGFEELCEKSVMNTEMFKIISNHGRKCKLNKFEIPAAITICKEAWTPESGLVTANLKINRRKIYEYYENEIQQMFSNKSAGLIF